MQDSNNPKISGFKEGGDFEKEISKEKSDLKEIEKESKVESILVEQPKIKSEKKKVFPTVEEIKKSAASYVPKPKRDEITEEEENMVEELVNITLKNPDLEKGLGEAEKLLEEKINLLKKIGRDYSYIIDEFHDRLSEALYKRNIF